LSGIRTHDPSNQPAKTHASGRTATVTGRRKYAKQILRNKILNQGMYIIRMIKQKLMLCGGGDKGEKYVYKFIFNVINI
jgi:hypothetical protein